MEVVASVNVIVYVSRVHGACVPEVRVTDVIHLPLVPLVQADHVAPVAPVEPVEPVAQSLTTKS